VLHDPRGFGWLTGEGPEVATRGGSVMASMAAQWQRRKKVLHGGGGGGAPLYRCERWMEKAV
jgi:hypothetical protein